MKFIISLLLLLIIAGLSFNITLLLKANNKNNPKLNTSFSKNITFKIEKSAKNKEAENVVFHVYVDNKLAQSFQIYEQALEFAKSNVRSYIRRHDSYDWLWDNFPPFIVFTKTTKKDYIEFNTYLEAVSFARTQEQASIYYRKNHALVFTNADELQKSHKIQDVPQIYQLPELARGCEVTSLAMLLQYKGINVSKMTLADEVAKDNTPYSVKDGKIYFGNPNIGFVGDMKSTSNQGYGVYRIPIFNLLSKYAEKGAIDISGCEFEDGVLFFVGMDCPVWVITNVTYNELPESEFQTWITTEGDIKVTLKEHAVLITGFDENFVYFNDPLGNKNYAEKEGFVKAWVQMGKQAVTIS